jgi:hypothetical protein
MAIGVCANFYANTLYRRLFNQGKVKTADRISISQLNKALKVEQDSQCIKEIRKCKNYHLIYLALFCTWVTLAVRLVFF